MNGINYNPMMYQPTYPQINPYSQQPLNNNINTSNLTWVQGIEGAKGYQISPNSKAVLLDSEQNRMYIKTSDDIGMCNLRIFDFIEVTETSATYNTVAQNIDLSNYVTRDELDTIISSIRGVNNNEQSISTDKSTKSNKSTITK